MHMSIELYPVKHGSQFHIKRQYLLRSTYLQEHCAKLEMRASDLSDRALTAERELLFVREQLNTRSTEAEASLTHLQGRLHELQQECFTSANQATASEQALLASDQRCGELQADLTTVTNTVR